MEGQEIESIERAPHSIPDLIIITGMSGAGRTEAMHTFEDLGYFCIDNLPPSLLIDLTNLVSTPDGIARKLAVVCDLRARAFFTEFMQEIESLKESGLAFNMLFLDSDTTSLLKRFKASRRRHPLCEKGMTLMDGIEKERAQLRKAKRVADYVIDTSNLKPQELRSKIRDIYAYNDSEIGLQVRVFSFGFKYGMPADADILIDVRFLPNPYYIDELRSLTGFDDEVREFIFSKDETKLFLERWHALLDVVMPGYVAEGKNYITIGLGCTGGQHRSVALAKETSDYLASCGYAVSIDHRDILYAEAGKQ